MILPPLEEVSGRVGSDALTLVMFYKAVVKAVLIYGSDMWFMSPHIRKMMVDLHPWEI